MPFGLDPSGHIACTLVALSLAETQAVPKSTVGRAFFMFLMAHSLWALFFTAYVFHSIFESYLGVTVGVVIIYGSRVVQKPFSDLLDLTFCRHQEPR